ncbi:hypothetical protein BDZ97DRAFT_137590 [Flammula alnicola]|nr:hypothetical protein BDZ97DRAFT_137590 [Flammula alnicola]
MPYIQKLNVVYGDDEKQQPHDAIECFSTTEGNPSRDVNNGMGGKHVWLVPVWTEDKNLAAEGFQFVDTRINRLALVREWKDDPRPDSDEQERKFPNLKEGCNPNTRAYIRLFPIDPEFPKGKVIKAYLFRSSESVLSHTLAEVINSQNPENRLLSTWGLAGATTDINRQRGGGYLYLGWNTDLAPGP